MNIPIFLYPTCDFCHNCRKSRKDQRKEKKYKKLQHEVAMQQKNEKGQGDTDSSSSQSQGAERGAAAKKGIFNWLRTSHRLTSHLSS